MTLQRDDFEYAGLNSRDDLQVEMGNVVLPSAPAMAEQATDIPAMYGNQFNGTDFTSRTISIPVSIYCADNQDRFNQIMHNLSGLLLSDDPSDNGKEYPLVFGFEPKVTYWGHITAISDPAPINVGMYDMTLTITFVQSDPRATLPQVETPLKNGLNTITVDGTARIAPVIQVVPKRALKYIGFNLNGGQFGLGPENPNDQDAAVAPYTEVVDDPMGSMAMWSNDANVISSMKINGKYVYQGASQIKTDTHVMMVALNSGKKNYGTMPTTTDNKWYGPAYRYTGMTNSLTDWRIRTGVHHIKYSGTHNGRAIGQVAVLLLDTNGETIGRFGIVDHGSGARPQAFLQLTKPGGTFTAGDGIHKDIYYGYGPSKAFTNKTDAKIKIKKGTSTKTVTKYKRSGGKVKKKSVKKTITNYTHVVNKEETDALSSAWIMLDMTKIGHTYTWSITQYDTSTGQPYTDANKYLIVHGTYVDVGKKYDTALGGIGSVMLKKPITEDIKKVSYINPFLSITNLHIWKANSVPANKPTYVATANSEIVMDCETDSTTVDGNLVSPVWSTDFPKLKPGVNSLTLTGDIDDAKITLKYLPRLL
ncbi:phage tail protein [Lactiplantibacillus pentosus]|uniref:phage tail family protein n=1 Tax=Lactiplantibacillus pentosus TaxID=1589 RepID=UPI0021A7A99D|nr:phage tail family protein [Lactiplantibacillus pentosus]MCT3305790.1 phage tail protein [Lactiplantibacillus pentosus]